VADTVRVGLDRFALDALGSEALEERVWVTGIAVLAGAREVDLAGTAAEPELLDLAPAVRRVLQ
jgi:hypothetical protein